MDPFLDDCIILAKRLKALGLPVGLDVLPGLPHGFLSFVKVFSQTYQNKQTSETTFLSKQTFKASTFIYVFVQFVIDFSCPKKPTKAIVCAFHD